MFGKSRLIFVRGEDDSTRHPKTQKLIRRTGDQLIRRRFRDITDLKAAVYASFLEQLERAGRLHMGPFDTAACIGATISDLDPKRVHAFLSRAQATPQAAEQVVKILQSAVNPVYRNTLRRMSDFKDREHFRKAYLDPLPFGWIINRVEHTLTIYEAT